MGKIELFNRKPLFSDSQCWEAFVVSLNSAAHYNQMPWPHLRPTKSDALDPGVRNF